LPAPGSSDATPAALPAAPELAIPNAASTISPTPVSIPPSPSSIPPMIPRAWDASSRQGMNALPPTRHRDDGAGLAASRSAVVTPPPDDDPAPPDDPPPAPEVPPAAVGHFPDEIHPSTVAAFATRCDHCVPPDWQPTHRSKLAAKFPATSAPVCPASADPETCDLR
jgi:hypothetical protein